MNDFNPKYTVAQDYLGGFTIWYWDREEQLYFQVQTNCIFSSRGEAQEYIDMELS